MALVTYGVTASVVLKWLNQIATGNSTLPGTTDITGEWINLAASEVEDAMLEGGFDSSAVDSTDEPAAYYLLRHLLARRAALYYAQASRISTNTDTATQMWEQTEELLKEIREGRRVGELYNATGNQVASLYTASDTTDDLDDYRACYDDVL